MIYMPTMPTFVARPSLSLLDRTIFASIAAMTVFALLSPLL
jgi:hypothetical protein